MSRRSLPVVPLLVLTGTMFLAPVDALAQGSQRDQKGMTTESWAQARPDGTTLVSETVLDARRKVVSSTRNTVKNEVFRAAAEEHSSFTCVSDGYAPGFTRRQRREALYQGRNDFAQALFFHYSLEVDRPGPTGRRQQWLICGVGGADGNNGSRITKSGPGMAFNDADDTFKIGQVWREGKTPADYSVSLGFEVGEGPVKVTGGIQQTPTDELKGSPRPTQRDKEMDRLARNGANGWWEHNCEPNCGGNGSPEGSSDYHGSVVEVLWDFPFDKLVTEDGFLEKIYWNHHCGSFSGVCR